MRYGTRATACALLRSVPLLASHIVMCVRVAFAKFYRFRYLWELVIRGGNGRNVSMRRLDSRLIHDGEDSGTLPMTYRPIFFVKKLVGQLTVLNQELKQWLLTILQCNVVIQFFQKLIKFTIFCVKFALVLRFNESHQYVFH